MAGHLKLVALYFVFGAALLGYGIWGFRMAQRAGSGRVHALGMNAAGFGIPCGVLSLAGAVSWLILYLYHA